MADRVDTRIDAMQVPGAAAAGDEVLVEPPFEELPEGDDAVLDRREVRDQAVGMVSGILVALRATRIPFTSVGPIGAH